MKLKVTTTYHGVTDRWLNNFVDGIPSEFNLDLNDIKKGKRITVSEKHPATGVIEENSFELVVDEVNL